MLFHGKTKQNLHVAPGNSLGWGWGLFLRWWPPSDTWVGLLIFLSATTRNVWIIPFFSNFEICATCWAHFICHHELWLTSLMHPFSFLNGSLGLVGGKHYQKFTIPIFWFSSKVLLSKIAFPIVYAILIICPYFLLVDLLLSGVPDYFGRNKISSGGDLSHYSSASLYKSFLSFCLICVY